MRMMQRHFAGFEGVVRPSGTRVALCLESLWNAVGIPFVRARDTTGHLVNGAFAGRGPGSIHGLRSWKHTRGLYTVNIQAQKLVKISPTDHPSQNALLPIQLINFLFASTPPKMDGEHHRKRRSGVAVKETVDVKQALLKSGLNLCQLPFEIPVLITRFILHSSSAEESSIYWLFQDNKLPHWRAQREYFTIYRPQHMSSLFSLSLVNSSHRTVCIASIELLYRVQQNMISVLLYRKGS